VGLQPSSYNKLIKTAKVQGVAGEKLFNSAIESFEPVFFNNLMLVLENYFVYRSQTPELKDGNPANEVRVLYQSCIKITSWQHAKQLN
jgi:hypothetical protein